MRMNLFVVALGSVILFTAVFVIVVLMPWITISDEPSDIFRPRTDLEEKGRSIYVRNGCTYCHTQFIRAMDWGVGAVRIARSGDYIADQPHLIGTERTGPDLSQAGGLHPNDWHVAHFLNPRFTSPVSVMPNWLFLGKDRIDALIAYVQSLGFQMADFRVARQKYWKQLAVDAYESGPDKNVNWLHGKVPKGWRIVPNPYPTTDDSQKRGHRMYQQFCIGCHGPVGDGMGPAEPFLYPPPLNFTILKDRGISGGILYYQIMNGITGTAMPFFKKDLESAKIWDVGNYVAVNFIGQTDSDMPPEGIDASYEPPGNEAIPETPPVIFPQEKE